MSTLNVADTNIPQFKADRIFSLNKSAKFRGTTFKIKLSNLLEIEAIFETKSPFSSSKNIPSIVAISSKSFILDLPYL